MLFRKRKDEIVINDLIVSFFVVCCWQALFTIFDKYIGGKLKINITLLIISLLCIYLINGNIKLY